MWRHIATVVFLITHANCNEIYIWQNSLFGCLESNGYESVAESHTTLMGCSIMKYCTDNTFKQFTRTVCGLIKSDQRKSHIRWSITQRKRTVLEWTFDKFVVFKKNAECSLSHVAMVTEHKISYFCGNRLTWKEYSKGNVTINQRFVMTLKEPSYFRLFFHTVYNTLLIEKRNIFRARVKNIIRTSPGFSHSIHVDDLMLFLIGSFPFQVLDITLTSTTKKSLLDLKIYDGPSKLTPALVQYSRSDKAIHEVLSTSSFQALVVVGENLAVEHSVYMNWSSHLEVPKFPKRQTYWHKKYFPHTKFKHGTSQNGLIHLWMHQSDDFIRLLPNSFLSFKGPDTYSNAVDLFCQYGGFWVYTSSDRLFTKPELQLQQCSNYTFSGKSYSKLRYRAFVVVQYVGISSIQFSYSDVKPRLARIRNWPYNDSRVRVAHYNFYDFHFQQIFSQDMRADNISLQLTGASQFNVMWVEVYFRHITPEKGCVCEAIVSHTPSLHDGQSWCTSEVQKRNGLQKTFLSETYRRLEFRKPQSLRLNCKKCFVSGFILFQMSQFIIQSSQFHYHFQLGPYSNVYSNVKPGNKWLYLQSAESSEMKIFYDGLDKQHSNSPPSSYVTFSECVNGKKFIRQVTVYAGSPVYHLTQGCVNACLISIIANDYPSQPLTVWLYPRPKHTAYTVKRYTTKADRDVQR